MRRLIRTVIAVLTLCLALTCFAACGKKGADNGGGGGGAKQVAEVSYGSIRVNETAEAIVLSWTAPGIADTYRVTCNGLSQTTESTSLDLTAMTGFVFPTDGKFNITIIAKANSYKDSKPTVYNYEAKGVDLDNPTIEGFADGVLSWASVTGASAYKVSLNGTVVSQAQENTTLDVKQYSSTPGVLAVDISAISNNPTFRRESAKTSVVINATRDKVTFAPISDFTVKDGVLSWKSIKGAKSYKIVDINQTVAAKVNGTSYDINDRILVYGVYPVSALESVADADMSAPSDIKYLNGAGTASDPYVIKTPFDLRAIDYYETMYAEKLKTSPAAQPNVYRIDNDIDYNSVAALEESSNIYTLTRPFYGMLDGNHKKLSNIRVRYDGGYWALFDFIAVNGAVKNIRFDNIDIYNEIVIGKDGPLPNGTSIATVAHHNYGTISGVTVKNALYVAKGGDVCGIATYNHKGATISGCSLDGNNEFKQEDTGVYSQACFEMAGITIENSGTVSSNIVYALTIRGSQSSYSEWQNDQQVIGHYNNVRTAAGIASYNRAGGVLSGNSYGQIDMVCMLNDYATQAFGGIVAQDGGTVSGSVTGTLTWSATQSLGAQITADYGTSANRRGKIRGYRG